MGEPVLASCIGSERPGRCRGEVTQVPGPDHLGLTRSGNIKDVNESLGGPEATFEKALLTGWPAR
jgi:hypothetical protein